jgi:hypothetical protein
VFLLFRALYSHQDFCSTYNEISEGVKTVTGVHIPRFIFPIDQVFPINATADDPAWLDVLDNTCKGEICLRVCVYLVHVADSNAFSVCQGNLYGT